MIKISKASAFTEILGFEVPTRDSFYESLLIEARETSSCWILIQYFEGDGRIIDLARKYMPPELAEKEVRRLRKVAPELETALASTVAEARSQRAYAHVGLKTDGKATVVVKSENGFVGCAVYDGLLTRKKAPRMATSLLYVVGLLSHDSTLINNVREVLPDIHGSGYADAATLERSIRDTLKIPTSSAPLSGNELRAAILAAEMQ